MCGSGFAGDCVAQGACSGEEPLVGRVWGLENGGMFLRRNRKRSSGEQYEYWTLCETVRTAKGPRQRVAATLGKLTGEDFAAGWEDMEALLDGSQQRPRQLEFAQTRESGREPS